MNRTIATLAAAAVLLTACTPVLINPIEAGPVPSNYRAAIRSYIVENFRDPYSLRDVTVTQPVAGGLRFRQGWVVCLRLNARNAMGGSTGPQHTSFLFQGDQIVASADQAEALA